MPKVNLGKNLQNARKTAGITQVALADALGVRQKDISRWERNEQTPNALTFGRWCEFIGASADEILEINL